VVDIRFTALSVAVTPTQEVAMRNQLLFASLLFTLTACVPSTTLAPTPCRPNTDCIETPRNSDRIVSVSGRGIFDTRTFVTISHEDPRVSKIEVLANGRPILVLTLGEIARFPLWPPMYRGQRVETIFFARGYDAGGKLIGTDSRRVSVYGGQNRAEEEVWSIRRLDILRRN